MPYPAFTGARTWATMTKLVNEVKPAQSFVLDLIFGGQAGGNTNTTENIEIDGIEDGRNVSPFTPRGAEAALVRGDRETQRFITPPNIRTKFGVRPDKMLLTQRAGYSQFATPAQQRQASQEWLARQMASMLRKVGNAKEYLACKAIQGSFTYALGDQTQFHPAGPIKMPSTYDVFSTDWGVITTPQATTTRAWDFPDGPTKITNIAADFRRMQRLGADNHGRPATVALFGRNLTEPFLADAGVKALLDNRRMEFGQIAPRAIGSQGEMYIGRFQNCDVWEYSQTMTLYDSRLGAGLGVNNSITDKLIADNVAIFLSPGPDSDFRLEYGGIYDVPQLTGASPAMKLFSKSWVTEDPAMGYYLVASRPLPVVTRSYTATVLKPLAADALA